MFRIPITACLIALITGFGPSVAQTPPAAPADPNRPAPPTRDPNTPGYVAGSPPPPACRIWSLPIQAAESPL
jgi:enterochelin esterase family protein